MDFENLIYKRRTIRRFKQIPIDVELLKKLVDYARMAPMAQNIQPYEYIIIIKKEIREELFKELKWANYLPPELQTPPENEKPMAYIVVIRNKNLRKDPSPDVGAAIENILLGATSFGLGSCWMGAIARNNIQKLLNIPLNYEVEYVISLGFPDEESEIEDYKDSFKYWKDKNGKMHVPKRKLNDIIYKII